MIKQTPSFGRIFAMVAFTLSCFGILVFLWLNFGGSVPLQPEGYRVTVGFPEATQLAAEADVRISGVRVGRVKKKAANPQTGLTDTELEIDARYAPIPKDTRAILRQKTLLGETYVELSPGTAQAGNVDDGGKLGAGQVADTVQLDEILRGFDPETRARFSTWFDQAGVAAQGQRGAPERRARAAHTVRGGHRRGAEGAAPAERRDAAPRARHRLRLRRAQRAQGPAARPDQELEPHLGGDREPRRPVGGHLPRVPDVPARGPRDHPAPDEVRRRHGSADHAAAARGARAVAHADRPRRAGTGPEGALPGPRSARARVEGAACRPPSRCSTTRVRSCAGSTRGCATSPRSSTTWACTSARSRPSS